MPPCVQYDDLWPGGPRFARSGAGFALGTDSVLLADFAADRRVRRFADLGCGVYVATVDGRHGTRGFVTDVMKQENLKYTYFYACGPALMYKAIEETAQTSGQIGRAHV